MIDDDMVRRLTGAFRNALVWGGAWFILAAVVGATIRLGDVPLPIALADGLFIGARVGFIGGIAGAAFAGLISVVCRGRRLSEISWLRFGVGGAIMAGLFVPGFLLAGNLISGDGFPVLVHILDDGIYAAVFGGITAAGSLKLAQRADALSAGTPHDLLDGRTVADSSSVGGATYAATGGASD